MSLPLSGQRQIDEASSFKTNARGVCLELPFADDRDFDFEGCRVAVG